MSQPRILVGVVAGVTARSVQALSVPDTADQAEVDEDAARVEDGVGPMDVWINDHPANLWEPVDDGIHGDGHGARGRFDDRSASHIAQRWSSHHRGVAGLAGAATVGALARLRR